MKIGITVNVGSHSIWSNGVNQNGIFLAMLLKKAGYDVDLIYSSLHFDMSKILNKYSIDINNVSLIKSFSIKYDIIIQLGLTIEKNMYDKWKAFNVNLKTVAYECGNHWFIESEKIMFGAHGGTEKNNLINGHIDQVWSIPQMEKTCLDFYSLKRGTSKATVVPFIWDPIFIERHAEIEEYKLNYNKRNIKKIGVLEPNISLMKNCIYPILILDKYYKIHGQLEKVYLIGGEKIKQNESFKNLISNTTLLKNNILTAEKRYQTLYILDNYADLIVSWQLENNLNYLWLDVAWSGWPIVHNGNMCKDVGYYYEGFNVDDAVKKIKEASDNHVNDIDYIKRNKKVIKRYTNKNTEIVKQYCELIEDLINNKFRKRKYNWKTNTIL
jgi:hypothetical protein